MTHLQCRITTDWTSTVRLRIEKYDVNKNEGALCTQTRPIIKLTLWHLVVLTYPTLLQHRIEKVFFCFFFQHTNAVVLTPQASCTCACVILDCQCILHHTENTLHHDGVPLHLTQNKKHAKSQHPKPNGASSGPWIREVTCSGVA